MYVARLVWLFLAAALLQVARDRCGQETKSSFNVLVYGMRVFASVTRARRHYSSGLRTAGMIVWDPASAIGGRVTWR